MAASSFRGMVVTTVFPGAFGALEFAPPKLRNKPMRIILNSTSSPHIHYFLWRRKAYYLMIKLVVAFHQIPPMEKHNRSKITHKAAKRTKKITGNLLKKWIAQR
jgi:hypothetical protein